MGPTLSTLCFIQARGAAAQAKWPTKKKHPGDTRRQFFRVLKWSLLALDAGKWPQKDWNGKDWPAGSWQAELAGTDLAGGFCAILWGLKGDLEHYFSAYDMANPGSKKPCSWCKADIRDDSKPWTDFREGAEWECTVYTPETWSADNPNPCLLLTIPGVTILCLLADLLHIKHLGVDQYFLGSLLTLMVYYMMTGTPQENLDVIWAVVLADLKDRGRANTYTITCCTLQLYRNMCCLAFQ